MLAVYKYNLFKYAKSPSTWVILLIACFIAGFLGGYLPYSSINTESDWAAKRYSKTIISIVAGMTTFLSLFVSVFAGFKAATMFKDEVEDGSFLVTLSKPITRRSIIFGKWLALQTTLIFFTFSSSATFAIFTYIFDCGDKVMGLGNFGTIPIKEKIISVSSYLWIIITLMGLIFSSIALLLSTWLSVGTTIGISIAIGVVIPITSLLSTFTKKEQYTNIQSPHGLIMHSRYNRIMDLANQYNLNIDSSELATQLNENDAMIKDPNSLYSLGFATGEIDGFKNIWPFDFDFQIHKLAEYASEEVVPEAIKNSIMAGAKGTQSFGAEGVSNQLNTNNELSTSEDKISDYDYIIKQMNKEIPSLWKLKETQLHYLWDVASKLFDQHTKFLTLPTDYDVNVRWANMITSAFPTTKSTDLDQVTTLRDILNTDHSHVDNTRTNLGYIATEDISNDPTKVPDAVIKSQWWVNWYKLSYEINASRGWNTLNTDVDAKAKYATWISAMKSLFDQKNNLGTAEITLNDFNGYVFNHHDALIRQAFNLSIGAMSISWPSLLKSEKQFEAAKAIGEIGALMEMTTRAINVLYFDIDVLLSKGKLYDLMKENNIQPLPDTEGVYNAIENAFPNYNLSKHDVTTMKAILGIAKSRPDLLVKIEAKGYVEKRSILLVYLFIAAALVPVSYSIVRRKDFR